MLQRWGDAGESATDSPRVGKCRYCDTITLLFFKSFYLFLETFFSHFSATKLPIKLLIAIRVKFELFKSYLSIWLYHVEMTRNALNSIKIPIQ